MDKLKLNSFVIFLFTFLFTILILTGCDRDFSILELKQEVILTVTIDPVAAYGEVTITNYMNRIIYVPYIKYPYCNFFIYELEQESESGQFERLWYHEYSYTSEDYSLGKWINEPSPANAICMMDMHPVQLGPSQSFTQKIFGLEPGKYRITVSYSYREDVFTNPSYWFQLIEQFTFKPEYIPGQVAVATMDTVSNDFFESFIIGLDLTLTHSNYDAVRFWIELPPDSADYFKNQLKYPPFSAKNFLPYPFDDIDSSKIYLKVDYKYREDTSDLTEGIAILNSLGLTLKRVEIYPPNRPFHYIVYVPIGTEECWINRFKTYPFIEWAELVYIMHGH